jgi:cold shock CspA family protein
LQTETGVGYILETGSGREISFHATALVADTFDRLSTGQQVEFEHQPYSKSSHRTRAINVRVVRLLGGEGLAGGESNVSRN